MNFALIPGRRHPKDKKVLWRSGAPGPQVLSGAFSVLAAGMFLTIGLINRDIGLLAFPPTLIALSYRMFRVSAIASNRRLIIRNVLRSYSFGWNEISEFETLKLKTGNFLPFLYGFPGWIVVARMVNGNRVYIYGTQSGISRVEINGVLRKLQDLHSQLAETIGETPH